MSTLYRKIYTKAIADIDDPILSATFSANSIDFFKSMYNFLNNAIPLFNNPTSEIVKLSDRTEPYGATELFDGGNISYALSTTPTGDYFFNCLVNDIAADYNYSSSTNTITFSSTPTAGTENVSIEWYDCGHFNQTLSEQEEKILSCFTVSCWGKKEKNFLLDIRRLLNDTDFHLGVESASMREKGNWYYSMREEAEKLMLQYAWTLHITEMKTKYNLS